MLAPELADRFFRLLDRPIWIITSSFEGNRGGLVATFVNQSSLDPARPVINMGLAPNHYTTELIEQSGRFTAHLLEKHQSSTALQFCLSSGRGSDKFQGVGLSVRHDDHPQLSDCLAWMDCQVITRLSGGDRIYFWGQATELAVNGAGPPLTERDLISSASDAQLEILRKDREHDIDLQAPLFQRWQDSLPASLRPLSKSTPESSDSKSLDQS